MRRNIWTQIPAYSNLGDVADSDRVLLGENRTDPDLIRQMVGIERGLAEEPHHVERARPRRVHGVEDLAANALHDRCHRHHGRDADHDAQNRECGAELVGRRASSAIPTPSSRFRRIMSFGAEGGDRIEPGRPRGGIHPEEDAGPGAQQESDTD